MARSCDEAASASVNPIRDLIAPERARDERADGKWKRLSLAAAAFGCTLRAWSGAGEMVSTSRASSAPASAPGCTHRGSTIRRIAGVELASPIVAMRTTQPYACSGVMSSAAPAHPERGKLRAMQLTIPLRGPSGEPVNLWRTLVSHGVADLPPMHVDEDERTLTATLPLAGAKPRTVVARHGKGRALVEVLGPRLGAGGERNLRTVLKRILNLDEDLSGFYEVAAADPSSRGPRREPAACCAARPCSRRS